MLFFLLTLSLSLFPYLCLPLTNMKMTDAFLLFTRKKPSFIVCHFRSCFYRSVRCASKSRARVPACSFNLSQEQENEQVLLLLCHQIKGVIIPYVVFNALDLAENKMVWLKFHISSSFHAPYSHEKGWITYPSILSLCM